MEKDEITRIRALPLSAVLESLGAARDPKDPAHNWRLGASRITVTDSRFFDHNEAGALHRMRDGRAGGGGAIDLVQYLKDVGFKEAVRELDGLDISRAVAPTVPETPSNRASADARPLPTPAPDRAARAHWYLRVVRMIPEAIVDEVFGNNQVFADARGNVVFRLRDEAGRELGYEVRGTYDKPYHSVYGEKGLFVTKADRSRTVAFVESGVEALRYRALRGTGLIVSTTGSAIEKPARMGRLLKARGYEIVTAFNADKSGDRMADRLREIVGSEVRRDRPPSDRGKDWNEYLKSLRAEHGVRPEMELDSRQGGEGALVGTAGLVR